MNVRLATLDRFDPNQNQNISHFFSRRTLSNAAWTRAAWKYSNERKVSIKKTNLYHWKNVAQTFNYSEVKGKRQLKRKVVKLLNIPKLVHHPTCFRKCWNGKSFSVKKNRPQVIHRWSCYQKYFTLEGNHYVVFNSVAFAEVLHKWLRICYILAAEIMKKIKDSNSERWIDPPPLRGLRKSVDQPLLFSMYCVVFNPS